MIWETSIGDATVAPEAPPWSLAAFAQLRQAFERQVTRAAGSARVADVVAARASQRSADAICDELSDD